MNYRNIVHLRRCPSSNKLANNDICLRKDTKDGITEHILPMQLIFYKIKTHKKIFLEVRGRSDPKVFIVVNALQRLALSQTGITENLSSAFIHSLVMSNCDF
jgi:hypothetical protein